MKIIKGEFMRTTSRRLRVRVAPGTRMRCGMGQRPRRGA